MMKRICSETKKIMPGRILSIVCIAGAIVLTGTVTACISNTAATTQASSAEAEAINSSAAAEAENTTSSAAADNTTTSDPSASTGTADANTASAGTDSTGISLDDAKAIALADAGLTAADVTYTAEGRDTDNGIAVYEIDFYTATTKYDYEIRISDGAILEKSTEAFQGGSAGTSDTSPDSYISAEEAKSIVLADAGLSAADVTFRKAMLERDDGIMVYEIDFYYGRTEYEYILNAVTGAILEFDKETD